MMLEDIMHEIKSANDIVILTHKDPDGDAIGSSLAMYLALKGINKKVDLIIPTYPKTFNFLPGIDEIKKESNVKNYDLAIALDCGDRERLNGFVDYFDNANKKISIDHHGTNTMFGDYNYVNPDAAATTQVLYLILSFLEIDITKDIAKCLYTGLLTDTGGFKYSSVTLETFEIAQNLLAKGINIAEISRKVLDVMTKKELELLKSALNRIELFEDEKIAITYITKEDMESIGSENGDHDGIVNYGRNIEGVEVSVLLREADTGFKASLRSNDYVNVSDVALIFGGGGHKKAAGCVIHMGLEEAKKAIVQEVKRYL